ncbi:unnamed protein product [Caenorhabditis angaria]|uniref:Uncharacterized protein n=1 Tax=Caenorhabditis angaria TaxID=860376 RepID=A0A9P1N6A6_9PELO|nr:unnamed protein product [Caenorhabditis angaria]
MERQPSQNAGVPSNRQSSLSDASEQEDLPFGQNIQRDQQLLTERANQIQKNLKNVEVVLRRMYQRNNAELEEFRNLIAEFERIHHVPPQLE